MVHGRLEVVMWMITSLTTLVAILLLTAPLPAAGQPSATIRIGYLSPGSTVTHGPLLDAFRQGLRELGRVEGQQLAIESRWAEGKLDRLPSLAAELVNLRVDIIVAAGNPAIQASRQATTTIPIVTPIVADPVTTGVVTNLAQPEGNVTGLSIMARDLAERQLGILKEVAPKVSRVALLATPTARLQVWQDAANTLGLQLQLVPVREPSEIDSAFAEMTKERVDAVVVSVETMFFMNRARIAELAVRNHLPAAYPVKDYVEAGGLVSSGVFLPDLYRRAASYVDRILKGAKAGDLPVETPAKYELVINLNTAKALGLTIPPATLKRADRVVQ
jgi:putative tryptophan/tyrosine transport system substrate-binding protein